MVSVNNGQSHVDLVTPLECRQTDSQGRPKRQLLPTMAKYFEAFFSRA